MNQLYVNVQSPASYEFAVSLIEWIHTLPFDAQADMMRFIYGVNQ